MKTLAKYHADNAWWLDVEASMEWWSVGVTFCRAEGSMGWLSLHLLCLRVSLNWWDRR
jgi:hypothetical protein